MNQKYYLNSVRYGASGVEFEGTHDGATEEETCVMELFFLPGQVKYFKEFLIIYCF